MGGGGEAKGENGRKGPPRRYEPARRREEDWDAGRENWDQGESWDDRHSSHDAGDWGPPAGKGREVDREKGAPFSLWDRGKGKASSKGEAKGYGRGGDPDDELWAMAKILASRYGRPPRSRNGDGEGWEREPRDWGGEPRDRWKPAPRDDWQPERREWERELRENFDREVNERWDRQDKGSAKGRKGGGKEGHSGKGKPEFASPKILVASLPDYASEDLVRDAFEMFGEIVDVKMMFDDRSDSKGSCQVTFASAEDAERVLDNHEFNEVDGTWVDCRRVASKPASGPSHDVKPGDWTCPECGNNVFAKKDQCNRCGYARQEGDRAQIPKGGGKGANVKGKPGDWICSACGDLVFASRDACKRCGEPRAQTSKRMGRKAGDWTCPNCGDLVFASKSACGLCQTPKPEREDGRGARASPY
mmetsp:Transcript_2368/g.4285  ORF Transcript_2368/g.4285 Transcript_2368/m.4285 type:complete len:418 (-) Transcript_2368:39-1292(-)|eukprot:CAMPEP_0197708632 /NCGR_PEP_ID=MMETSP1338-20131121/128050_1 /TAXON_ID=43686 ORGANISM="Pelagodinium beii, Strain RCC1491" /NCGR_SAMPLE_ID=MMETSP1338 /ASSEMBLY_ACC=CAM_ASM_000754 /LENGTH=417 /DNA_ID=CAMNT_0043292563 /DNA_START=61 /DNA_END=1314 /DNA_ORIENTATION=+